MHDLRHLAVQQRLAAGDRHHRRAAFVDRRHALVVRQALIEDLVRIVDLAAAGAGEIAAEQRLQHQHQRIALAAGEMLLSDIGADPGGLRKGNSHAPLRLLVRRLERRPMPACAARLGSRNSICLAHAFHLLRPRPRRCRRSASITSSTSSSGAEAPAVRPTAVYAHEPGRIELAAVGDQVARHAFLEADLAQPVGIGAVLGADHQQQIDDIAKLAHGRLAVLGGIADVRDVRALTSRGNAPGGRRSCPGVVDAERRLGHIGHGRIVRDVETRQRPRSVETRCTGAPTWPIVPSTSGWPAWPIRIKCPARAPHSACPGRAPSRPAGRSRRARAGPRRFASSMTDWATPWALKIVTAPSGISFSSSTNTRALALELFDHMPIVHDLVPDIDRRAVFLERPVDDVDRPDDARAEAARLSHENPHPDQFLPSGQSWPPEAPIAHKTSVDESRGAQNTG